MIIASSLRQQTHKHVSQQSRNPCRVWIIKKCLLLLVLASTCSHADAALKAVGSKVAKEIVKKHAVRKVALPVAVATTTYDLTQSAMNGLNTLDLAGNVAQAVLNDKPLAVAEVDVFLIGPKTASDADADNNGIAAATEGRANWGNSWANSNVLANANANNGKGRISIVGDSRGSAAWWGLGALPGKVVLDGSPIAKKLQVKALNQIMDPQFPSVIAPHDPDHPDFGSDPNQGRGSLTLSETRDLFEPSGFEYLLQVFWPTDLSNPSPDDLHLFYEAEITGFLELDLANAGNPNAPIQDQIKARVEAQATTYEFDPHNPIGPIADTLSGLEVTNLQTSDFTFFQDQRATAPPDTPDGTPTASETLDIFGWQVGCDPLTSMCDSSELFDMEININLPDAWNDPNDEASFLSQGMTDVHFNFQMINGGVSVPEPACWGLTLFSVLAALCASRNVTLG